ncbi:D-glycero-beta-D-manno-heptose-7-phosphate kinase [Komagataeibacter sp. FNDCF1]|uniref:D-glycero-beta-D-manno-heptose-7-phosphate kinase n=1 Tax=Komagataeibacter sp. FNDCF1 TaxID=2878681 RepID=UPI001E576362|nr:D-glycero-beta-D-manno-heptose-7-phosphate kinase [Komagataeibacter sp. FNDCF1]MCE2565370.1 D-glycero-beta-D-manno-heptose-7-phosphate kinase [Komagataeibacter sp. FNDCF1]
MIDNMQFGTIAVIGDVMLDRYISGTVSRISPEAPIPVVLHEKLTTVAGGAANVATNAAALGACVLLTGLVGADEFAPELIRTLGRWEHISTDGLVTDASRPTITKTRVMSGRQQIVRIDNEDTTPLDPAITTRLVEQVHAAIDRADIVVCSDYGKGVLNDAMLAAIFARAHARGIPVIVDPKRSSFAAYRGASLITPNRHEMARATGLPLDTDAQVAAAAQAASAQFGGNVLVTRSDEGMTLWQTDGRVTHVRARAAEVFDVSGAGDTVVATLATILSAGQPVETAVTIAGTAASISVGKLGTATVSRAELGSALMRDTQDSGKLVTLEQAASIASDWRHHGMRVVFTNGCFDLLHPGHISLLQAAAAQGDKLIVALNTDRSVRRLKGESRPIQDELARAAVIGALRAVDLVVLFDEDTPLDAIRAIMPDILVKGADYREDQVVGGHIVKAGGGRVVLVDIVSGRSTTALVKAAARP